MPLLCIFFVAMFRSDFGPMIVMTCNGVSEFTALSSQDAVGGAFQLCVLHVEHIRPWTTVTSNFPFALHVVHMITGGSGGGNGTFAFFSFAPPTFLPWDARAYIFKCSQSN